MAMTTATAVDRLIGVAAMPDTTAEATSDRQDADRRALATVAATYPELAERLRAHPLAGTAVRKLIGHAPAQLEYIAGAGADTASNPRQRWEVRWRGESSTETVAAIIASKLLANPALAQAVLQQLTVHLT